MNLAKIITAFCSFSFIMIGADKFLNFLEPPCSMMEYISPIVWKILGAIQILAGLLIWTSELKKYITGFFAVFMFVFTAVHLSQGTSDVGGAAFMAVLLSILTWNPPFLSGKKE